MEPQLICNDSDHDAWLMARMDGLGGSDAPAVLGMEKAWGSPFSVSCIKRGITPPEGDVESELMKWGHYSEAPMLAAFSDETGHQAKISGGLFKRQGNATLDFMMTTLDGVVTEKGGKVGGAECKLKIFDTKEWETEGVPAHVLCQNQHTMEVMDWDFIYTIVLLDGYRPRYRKIERERDWVGDILAPAEVEFWKRLQDGEQFDAGVGRPSINAQFLKYMHPNDNGETVALEGTEYIQLYDDWRVHAEERKAAKKLEDAAKNSLVQALGDNTFAVLDDGRRFSNKSQTRKAYPVKESTFRVMR